MRDGDLPTGESQLDLVSRIGSGLGVAGVEEVGGGPLGPGFKKVIGVQKDQIEVRDSEDDTTTLVQRRR